MDKFPDRKLPENPEFVRIKYFLFFNISFLFLILVACVLSDYLKKKRKKKKRNNHSDFPNIFYIAAMSRNKVPFTRER